MTIEDRKWWEGIEPLDRHMPTAEEMDANTLRIRQKCALWVWDLSQDMIGTLALHTTNGFRLPWPRAGSTAIRLPEMRMGETIADPAYLTPA